MSKSQQLIDTRNALFTTFTFWFHFFRSADKIDEDDAFVHLILPPPPCHVTARVISILGHSAFTELPLSPTHPAFLFDWRSGTLLPSCLPIGWGSGKLRLNMRSRVCTLEGEGGAWYNIIRCRMAEGTQDPCISHIDASHVEWPRTESSLLFCIFFYIVKVIEKSLFYEQEIGFIRK